MMEHLTLTCFRFPREDKHGAVTSHTFHSMPHARLSLRIVIAAAILPSNMAPKSISAQQRYII